MKTVTGKFIRMPEKTHPGRFYPQAEFNRELQAVSSQRSAIMSKIRSRGNRSTELRMVHLLRLGSIKGWRRHARLPGTPDFVFPRARVALFVDGCFWHGCPEHYVAPAINAEFWRAKLERNVARDRAADRALSAMGWKVLRFWEHELCDADAVGLRIAMAVSKGRMLAMMRAQRE